jgi:hypothetical protein
MQGLIGLAMRQAAQPYLDMGRSALVKGVTIASLTLVGAGFVLAAAVMGLAWLVGPIAASALTGLAMLSCAILIARRPRLQAQTAVPQNAPPLQQHTHVAELSFALGFVFSRVMLRKLARKTQ